MSESNETTSTLKAFDNWWFGKGSPTTLGVFRIFVGALTLINFLLISFDWKTWFSEHGFVPNWLAHQWQGPNNLAEWNLRLNVLSGVTDDRLALAFYVLTCLVAFTTMIGLWTRASSIILAICVVSLHHRNEAMLHGGDTVVRLMCLYIAISPAGRACSVDRLIRLWKGIETGAAIQVSLWAQRLVQYNVALIYFTTTWLKWHGNLWKNGTATYYTAKLHEFDRFPVPGFINEKPFIYFTTYGTLLVEFMLATLVFYKPFRKYALIGGLIVHAGIEYSMNIPLFSYLMVAMYITFYDGEEIADWFKRLGARLKRFATTVFLPKGQRFSPQKADFFSAVDPLGIVTYEEGTVEELPTGEVSKSWRHSLGALPWAWWPGVWRKLMLQSLDSMPTKKKKSEA